jgi:hypothetical protein
MTRAPQGHGQKRACRPQQQQGAAQQQFARKQATLHSLSSPTASFLHSTKRARRPQQQQQRAEQQPTPCGKSRATAVSQQASKRASNTALGQHCVVSSPTASLLQGPKPARRPQQPRGAAQHARSSKQIAAGRSSSSQQASTQASNTALEQHCFADPNGTYMPAEQDGQAASGRCTT